MKRLDTDTDTDSDPERDSILVKTIMSLRQAYKLACGADRASNLAKVAQERGYDRG